MFKEISDTEDYKNKKEYKSKEERKIELLKQLTEEFSIYSSTHETLIKTDFKYIPEFVQADLEEYLYSCDGNSEELIKNIKTNSDYSLNEIKKLIDNF